MRCLEDDAARSLEDPRLGSHGVYRPMPFAVFGPDPQAVPIQRVTASPVPRREVETRALLPSARVAPPSPPSIRLSLVAGPPVVHWQLGLGTG